MAEVWALFKLMRSIAGVGEIWVAINNQGVQREPEHRRTGHSRPMENCPGLRAISSAQGLSLNAKSLSGNAQGLGLNGKVGEFIQQHRRIGFQWAASHGNHEGWEPPSGHSNKEWRSLDNGAE